MSRLPEIERSFPSITSPKLMLSYLSFTLLFGSTLAFSQDTAPVERPTQYADRKGGPRLVETNAFIEAGLARQQYNVSGNGLNAAVIDSGLNTTHVDFKGRVREGINLSIDYNGSPDLVSDGHGHGTHVSGIIAANGDHVGIAPGAGIVPIKVLSNLGGVSSFDVLEKALQWVLDHHKAYQITVVNMSIGDGRNHLDAPPDSFQDKLKALRAQKVAVVAAAGNSFYSFKSKQGMTYPAIFPETISVGAVYDADIGPYSYRAGAQAYTTGPGRITPFSQRLHENIDPARRTDIFAPGASIRSSGIESEHGEAVMHGTSQSSPVVVGMLLLMQEYYLREYGTLPTVEQLEEWLRIGSTTIHDGDDENDNVKNTDMGYPLANVVRTLRAMAPPPPPEFTSPPSATPQLAITAFPITFRAPLQKSPGHAYQVEWAFGDGSTGSGESTTHAYEAPGSYTVSVTARGGHQQIVNHLVVEVQAAESLEIKALRIRTRLNRPESDVCLLRGTLSWPEDMIALGASASINVGGAQLVFELNGRGTGRNGKSQLHFNFSRHPHDQGPQSVAFRVRLRGDDWAQLWEDDGLVDGDIKNTDVTIPVILRLNKQAFGSAAQANYVARSGEGGQATYGDDHGVVP